MGVTYAEAQGYKAGPTIGAATVTSATYASDYQTYGGGVAYTLAPGFVVQADLMYVDEKLRNFSPTVPSRAPTTQATSLFSTPA